MNMNKYTPVIGLEIHVQLATKSKMFSRCSADWFGKAPNTVVCPVSLGLPGALPVPNKKAIELAILMGLALNCKVNKVSKFDRKHYFYPDLPKGYQISQYDQPFCYDGSVKMKSKLDGTEKYITIRRAHLEEDTGKLVHDGGDTLVDFNRAGVPLLEIVTEPDFNNAEDVKQFLEELQVLIRYVGASEANMEKGSMRLEPNISVKLAGQNKLPDYKVEVKNINSFKFAKSAIEYEFKRQIDILEKGQIPKQETRGYDEKKGITVQQRVKEEAADYRYFPEPDIPPLVLDDVFVSAIKQSIPTLPEEKIAHYQGKGITYKDAYILTRDVTKAQKFDDLINHLSTNDEIVKAAILVVNGKIDITDALQRNIEVVKSSLNVVETDKHALKNTIHTVLNEHQDVVSQYKQGKDSAIMFLVGQVMKVMKGKANPKDVIAYLKNALDNQG